MNLYHGRRGGSHLVGLLGVYAGFDSISKSRPGECIPARQRSKTSIIEIIWGNTVKACENREKMEKPV